MFKSIFKKYNYSSDASKASKKDNLIILTCCFISAFVILSVCSRSSFLYPFNDWVDSNCFFTVGKAMANGQVLYMDIYEQKGVLLYVLHMLCYFISNDTFIGVFVLEVICSAVFLYFLCRVLMFYTSRNTSLLLMPLFGTVVYSSHSFCYGDSAEELCLPVFMYIIYISSRALKEERNFKTTELFLIGVLSACVLWIKFTMLSIFVGMIITPFFIMIIKKQWKNIFKTIFLIFAGVSVATIPFVIYFAVNGAVKEWIEVYFYNNIFLYSSTNTGEKLTFMQRFTNLFCIYNEVFIENIQWSVLSVIGLITFLLKEKNTIIIHLTVMMITTFVLTYIGGRSYPYYAFILSVYAVFGFAAFSGIINLLVRKLRKPFLVLSLAISLMLSSVLAFALSENTFYMEYKKEDLPQYKFKEIICQKEAPTLLNYAFLDGGFYTSCNIVPNCKYFCKLNIPLEDMYATMRNHVKKGLSDFVITRDKKLDTNIYHCVSTASIYFEGSDRTYYLYQKVQ